MKPKMTMPTKMYNMIKPVERRASAGSLKDPVWIGWTGPGVGRLAEAVMRSVAVFARYCDAGTGTGTDTWFSRCVGTTCAKLSRMTNTVDPINKDNLRS